MHGTTLALIAFLATAALPTAARAQLALTSQFSTATSSVGGAYSAQSDTIWQYASFGTVLRELSRTGTLLGTIPRPGNSANDADLAIAPVTFQLGGVTVPQGSVLFIDGESGGAEIYAVDPSNGAVIASLAAAFGNSHVVGGAYHVQRGTFFLVQDRVASG